MRRGGYGSDGEMGESLVSEEVSEDDPSEANGSMDGFIDDESVSPPKVHRKRSSVTDAKKERKRMLISRSHSIFDDDVEEVVDLLSDDESDTNPRKSNVHKTHRLVRRIVSDDESDVHEKSDEEPYAEKSLLGSPPCPKKQVQRRLFQPDTPSDDMSCEKKSPPGSSSSFQKMAPKRLFQPDTPSESMSCEKKSSRSSYSSLQKMGPKRLFQPDTQSDGGTLCERKSIRSHKSDVFEEDDYNEFDPEDSMCSTFTLNGEMRPPESYQSGNTTEESYLRQSGLCYVINSVVLPRKSDTIAIVVPVSIFTTSERMHCFGAIKNSKDRVFRSEFSSINVSELTMLIHTLLAVYDYPMIKPHRSNGSESGVSQGGNHMRLYCQSVCNQAGVPVAYILMFCPFKEKYSITNSLNIILDVVEKESMQRLGKTHIAHLIGVVACNSKKFLELIMRYMGSEFNRVLKQDDKLNERTKHDPTSWRSLDMDTISLSTYLSLENAWQRVGSIYGVDCPDYSHKEARDLVRFPFGGNRINLGSYTSEFAMVVLRKCGFNKNVGIGSMETNELAEFQTRRMLEINETGNYFDKHVIEIRGRLDGKARRFRDVLDTLESMKSDTEDALMVDRLVPYAAKISEKTLHAIRTKPHSLCIRMDSLYVAKDIGVFGNIMAGMLLCMEENMSMNLSHELLFFSLVMALHSTCGINMETKIIIFSGLHGQGKSTVIRMVSDLLLSDTTTTVDAATTATFKVDVNKNGVTTLMEEVPNSLLSKKRSNIDSSYYKILLEKQEGMSTYVRMNNGKREPIYAHYSAWGTMIMAWNYPTNEMDMAMADRAIFMSIPCKKRPDGSFRPTDKSSAGFKYFKSLIEQAQMMTTRYHIMKRILGPYIKETLHIAEYVCKALIGAQNEYIECTKSMRLFSLGDTVVRTYAVFAAAMSTYVTEEDVMSDTNYTRRIVQMGRKMCPGLDVGVFAFNQIRNTVYPEDVARIIWAIKQFFSRMSPDDAIKVYSERGGCYDPNYFFIPVGVKTDFKHALANTLKSNRVDVTGFSNLDFFDAALEIMMGLKVNVEILDGQGMSFYHRRVSYMGNLVPRKGVKMNAMEKRQIDLIECNSVHPRICGYFVSRYAVQYATNVEDRLDLAIARVLHPLLKKTDKIVSGTTCVHTMRPQEYRLYTKDWCYDVLKENNTRGSAHIDYGDAFISNRTMKIPEYTNGCVVLVSNYYMYYDKFSIKGSVTNRTATLHDEHGRTHKVLDATRAWNLFGYVWKSIKVFVPCELGIIEPLDKYKIHTVVYASERVYVWGENLIQSDSGCVFADDGYRLDGCSKLKSYNGEIYANAAGEVFFRHDGVDHRARRLVRHATHFSLDEFLSNPSGQIVLNTFYDPGARVAVTSSDRLESVAFPHFPYYGHHLEHRPICRVGEDGSVVNFDAFAEHHRKEHQNFYGVDMEDDEPVYRDKLGLGYNAYIDTLENINTHACLGGEDIEIVGGSHII